MCISITRSRSAAAPPVTPTAADALRRYNEELSRLRAKVVELQDREIAIQLKMQDFKNQLLSPVTDTTARSQAQSLMEQAQNDFLATQNELAAIRRQLAVMEVAGPPKP